jgi:hypothetical protein
MEDKNIQINDVAEKKEVKENVVDEYYEAESRQFSGCGD